MIAFFRVRPLALAGPAAVAGVLGADAPAVCVTAVVVAGVWALLRHSPPALLTATSLLAGLVAGRTVDERAARALALGAHVESSLSLQNGSCTLAVDGCGEDPFRGRAWLTGRIATGCRVLCVWPGPLPDAVLPDARVHVTGRFRVPQRPANPGEDDRRRRLARQGIGLTAEPVTVANVRTLCRSPPGPAAMLARLRRDAARRLAGGLPPASAGLAAALLLGVRGGIDTRDRLRFERTGTMHVLAISGLHLVLLAGMLNLLLRRLGLGVRTCAAVTLAFTLCYVPVAGSGPPIRRAATAVTLYGVALLRGRPPDPASALGGAALFLALVAPEDVDQVGFRLSFAAAAGIVLLAPAWRERWGRRHRLLARFPAVREDRPLRLFAMRYVLRAAPVAVAAWLSTQAFVAEAFGTVTPLAPVANLAIAPLVALMLPLAAMTAAGIGPAACAFALLADLQRGLLDLLTELPGASLSVPPPPACAVALWALGVALFRRSAVLGLPTLLGAVATAIAGQAAFPPGLVLLDVGNGQAALLRFEDGSAVLVDAGSSGRPGLARRTILPALRALGVRRLEGVVCSHGDADHWNALPDLLGSLTVDRIHVGTDPPPGLLSAARRHGVPIRPASGGATLHAAGSTRLRVLAADPGESASDNERSLVLLFEAGRQRVLLPADREGAGLRALLQGAPPRCTAVVAPHHGASAAETSRLAAAVRARWILVSSARPGPAPEDLPGDVRTLSTSRDGAVRIDFDLPDRLAVARCRRGGAGTRATIRTR